MKLLKLAKLGHRNVTHHKKQTILTVIVIGSLFGVLIGLHFIIQGIENTFLKQNDQVFSGKTYLVAHGCSARELKQYELENPCFEAPEEEMIDCLSELNKKPFPCGNDTVKINGIFNDKVKSYGGKVVGNIKLTSNEAAKTLDFYPSEIFADLITADMSQKPNDALMALVSFQGAAKLAEIKYGSNMSNQEKLTLIQQVYEKTIGKVFEHEDVKVFVAGILPFGSSTAKLAKYDADIRLIDSFLENINSYGNNLFYYLDDNSDATQKTLQEYTTKFHQVIIEFDSSEQAYEYFRHNMPHPNLSLFNKQAPENPEYVIWEMVTNKIDIIYQFKFTRFFLSFANYVLLATAVVIIVFTFIRLVNQDSKIMALYRSLGATATDVFLIYFWYVLELCMLAVFYACAVAGIIAFAVSSHYSADFNVAFSLFFGENLTDFKLFIGFNQEIWQIITLILLSAPLVSILTIDQLSMKNIARRLKQQ